MNKKCQKFLVDVFNLIFGSGQETDDFWTNILEKKVIEQFQVKETFDYYDLTAEDKDIANKTSSFYITSKEKVNLNTLFYALIFHLCLEIHP